MPVRVGFIGVGGIARHHLGKLAGMEDVEFVAFCDVDEERAKWAASQYGGKAYTDYKEMYEREDLDAVFICLPPFAHTDQELLAAERGIALFVEKPLGLSAEKAEEVASVVRERGVISSVGYHFRYMEATDRAREFMEGREVGFALGYWIGGMPGVSWWRRMEGSGGQVVEQTTHIFD
ncbi:MAG: gfo/Idh/MocA family oxidoreductase, partial [Candidatus Latescibacterota bacterium]